MREVFSQRIGYLVKDLVKRKGAEMITVIGIALEISVVLSIIAEIRQNYLLWKYTSQLEEQNKTLRKLLIKTAEREKQ